MTRERTRGLTAAVLAAVVGVAPATASVITAQPAGAATVGTASASAHTAGANASRAATAGGGQAAGVATTSAAAAAGGPAAGTAARALSPAVTGLRSDSVWQPTEDTDWMWELGQPLNTGNAKLMGTGVTAWNGDAPPGDNPALYDIDAIENPAATVTTLHQMGDHAICYIEVGSAGNYYTAAQEGIPTTYYAQLKAAGDLGNKLKGYPEYFINVNASSAVSIIEAMIDQQCAAKGFDGVETDLDETFGSNEGKTGFTITVANEESYLTTLANYMHGLGLAWIAKNLDDTENASFVDAMEPLAQGTISEQCNQYKTCSYLSPFETDGKWIGNAEYSTAQSTFCPVDNAADINGILFNVNLNGGRNPCR